MRGDPNILNTGDMNTISRAVLQAIVVTDADLSAEEHQGLQRLIDGRAYVLREQAAGKEGHILVTQKMAAKLLSVSRVTIWRMSRNNMLRTVEILPGTFRYSYEEIVALALRGQGKPK